MTGYSFFIAAGVVFVFGVSERSVGLSVETNGELLGRGSSTFEFQGFTYSLLGPFINNMPPDSGVACEALIRLE